MVNINLKLSLKVINIQLQLRSGQEKLTKANNSANSCTSCQCPNLLDDIYLHFIQIL